MQIEPRFAKAAGFTHNPAVASLPDSNGMFGLIDRTGKLVATAVWREIDWFNGNLFHVTDADGAIGLVDDVGRIVIEPYHPTPEEQKQIGKSSSFIRGHPFTL